MFFLGSVALGVFVSRFLKASADQSNRTADKVASDMDSAGQVGAGTDRPAYGRRSSAEAPDFAPDTEPATVAEAKGY
jgi:hypothetical protein